MGKSLTLFILLGWTISAFSGQTGEGSLPLEEGWDHPPLEAKLRAYWWWLNGHVDPPAITRDLEEMAAKGFGGVTLMDAGGATQDGNRDVPAGPPFGGSEWRALFRHTLKEAHRLGLEVDLNIQSGWNLGGPRVPIEDSGKSLVFSETSITGGGAVTVKLPVPKINQRFYRDVRVVAYPLKPGTRPRPIRSWEQKTSRKSLAFSAPVTIPLLTDETAITGEEETITSAVVDVSDRMDPDGTLRWAPPAGSWNVLRFGFTHDEASRVSTSSPGGGGFAIDVLDHQAFARYWDDVVEPLLLDAGEWTGTTLRCLHTDSWEIEGYNWTGRFPEEFRTRRGYDMTPYFPVLAGHLVESREVSNRFLNDFRKTLGDLAMDEHYKPFIERAHRHGLLLHPESGGPHGVPIDAQRCLGQMDQPMSEFWSWSPRHRVGEANRFFVKQPASAAHTYGRRFVVAEGFTNIGMHWQESLWDNLKPSFDYACTEGLNRLVWHAFTCSPLSAGVPGQQYFAGTHLDPQTTWWSRSAPFFAYINRCQWLLSRGLFVADVVFYYGDHVPNFTQLRSSDPAALGAGYDYDVITEEALIERLQVKEGRLVLPDGMSYALLVLPDRPAISLPVLRKVRELARAGAHILGPEPRQTASLTDYPQADAEVQSIARELWQGPSPRIPVGKDSSARKALQNLGLKPDFAYVAENPATVLSYIHRRETGRDIYFVSSRDRNASTAICSFRIAGQAPELWNAVSGLRSFAPTYTEHDGITSVPLSLPPNGSVFVVFQKSSSAHPPGPPVNPDRPKEMSTLTGPWTVHFDPQWNGPETVQFPELKSWTENPEPGIRYYSGTATYQNTFRLPENSRADTVTLDLGEVRELAEVRVNGKSLGILWSPPFQVDLTTAAHPGENILEVDVVNFWANRVIGDAGLPESQQRTRTNIRRLGKDTPLLPSGLLGPVKILFSKPDPAPVDKGIIAPPG